MDKKRILVVDDEEAFTRGERVYVERGESVEGVDRTHSADSEIG